MIKRIRLNEGDVFELTLPDGRFGYGVIIKRGLLKGGGTPYIAIFRSAHRERPDVARLTADEVALAGWTTDALVYHGQWTVVAHDLPRPVVPFPNFKVGISGKVYTTDVEGQVIDEATAGEQDLLDFRFSRSAALYQDAFEALHGFGEWKDFFDKVTPAYSRLRGTRPDWRS